MPGPGLVMGLLEREWDMEQLSRPPVTSILVVSRTSLSFSLRKDTVFTEILVEEMPAVSQIS